MVTVGYVAVGVGGTIVFIAYGGINRKKYVSTRITSMKTLVTKYEKNVTTRPCITNY